MVWESKDSTTTIENNRAQLADHRQWYNHPTNSLRRTTKAAMPIMGFFINGLEDVLVDTIRTSLSVR